MRHFANFVRRLRDSSFRIPFVSTNIHFGSNAAIRILSSPIRSKVSALSMGAAGIGQYGTVQNYQALAFSVGSLGLGTGLTAEVSRRVKEKDQAGVNEALRVSFSALMAASVFSVLALFGTLDALINHLFKDPALIPLMIPPILALPFYCFGTCYLEPVLYGHGMQPHAATAYKVSATADLLAFVPLVYLFKATGASYSILIATIVHFSTLLFIVRRYCPTTKLFRFGFHASLFRTFLKTGLTMLLAGAATYGVSLAIRAIIVRTIGEAENGYYQIALALSAFYTPFITSATWVRLYPQVGGHGLDDSAFLEFTEALVFSAFFAALTQTVILVAPGLTIKTLWTRDFMAAARILPFRLIGDFGFLLSQPVLGVLMGLQARRVYLALHMGSQIVFAALAFLLSGSGLMGLVEAYAIANLALLVICMAWYFRRLSASAVFSPMRLSIFWMLTIPFVSVLIQGYLSGVHKLLPLRGGIFLGTCLWFLLALKKFGLKDLLALRARFHPAKAAGA